MLIVMLIKGEKRNLLPAVHAGWILALVAGIFTWWASHTLITISGAMRGINGRRDGISSGRDASLRGHLDSSQSIG